MSCKLCDGMEASFLILFTFWCGVFGLSSASLSISLPDVSMSGILDALKDTGWGTKWGVDDIDPGLTTRFLNVTLCPWLLPDRGVSGTWGRWNTSSSLTSPPLFKFLSSWYSATLHTNHALDYIKHFHPLIGQHDLQVAVPVLTWNGYHYKLEPQPLEAKHQGQNVSIWPWCCFGPCTTESFWLRGLNLRVRGFVRFNLTSSSLQHCSSTISMASLFNSSSTFNLEAFVALFLLGPPPVLV